MCKHTNKNEMLVLGLLQASPEDFPAMRHLITKFETSPLFVSSGYPRNTETNVSWYSCTQTNPETTSKMRSCQI